MFFTIPYCCILSMAIVANYNKCILLEFAPIMLAFCSLLFPSYFSKYNASKIGASLYLCQHFHCYYILVGTHKYVYIYQHIHCYHTP